MDKCKDYVQLDDFEATVITLAMVHEAVDGGAPGKEKRSSRRSGQLSTARDDTNATRDTDLDSVEMLMLPVKGNSTLVSRRVKEKDVSGYGALVVSIGTSHSSPELIRLGIGM